MSTRERVLELRAAGSSQALIADRLGIAKSTVAYHLRRAGEPPDERCNRRYDWAEVQRFYDEGHSITTCQERFGFARETFNAARRRGDVVPRRNGRSLEETFVIGAVRDRAGLKRRLLAAGLKQARCETCGIEDWQGQPLSLALHHVNGDGLDNRLENLQLLCPNCHSQTDTFAGRKRPAAA